MVAAESTSWSLKIVFLVGHYVTFFSVCQLLVFVGPVPAEDLKVGQFSSSERSSVQRIQSVVSSVPIGNSQTDCMLTFILIE